MDGKKNCWEVKNCGRQPGGAKAAELGICPAAKTGSLDGVHGGRKGGRVCWMLAGTLCGAKVQGTYAHKMMNCMSCDFFKTVMDEEGSRYIGPSKLLEMARNQAS
jgi:hypothetical protein